ncbi:hypothetical protein BZG36_02166 [Bifiguratus adelaidae]|uniref:Vesicular-fusion protein sec17 n=1 Tax=Bifiguratus adelaidae TaxID=1938954 RepID=A0A261Y0N0_9FUNG|nr:hypothetical protein BZG36_02166 [Bifiguratus adelaidae]
MSEKQAQEYLAQADKKLTGWSFFGGGSQKYDDAAELYIKAGNTFKLAQRPSEAGDAFMKAAEMHGKSSDTKFEAAKDFDLAAKSYKKTRPDAAVNALMQAIAIDKDIGNFRAAARHHQDVAEIFENEMGDLRKAWTHYDQAAQLFQADDSPANANKCILKAAHFAAQLEDYNAAIEKFESVAEQSVDNQLTKWSLKDYFMKSVLCQLCTRDIVRAKQSMQKYAHMDMSFERTREYSFLQNIITAVEEGDVDLFTKEVYDFDQLTKFDDWKTTILLRIKKSVDEEPDLL